MKTEYIIHSIYKVERCGILIYDPHVKTRHKDNSGAKTLQLLNRLLERDYLNKIITRREKLFGRRRQDARNNSTQS